MNPLRNSDIKDLTSEAQIVSLTEAEDSPSLLTPQ